MSNATDSEAEDDIGELVELLIVFQNQTTPVADVEQAKRQLTWAVTKLIDARIAEALKPAIARNG